MSIKKLLGKVAVGAAVGALVIAGATMVVAQHPGGGGDGSSGTGLLGTSANSLTNYATGMPNLTGTFTVEYDVEKRAYLYAIPATGADAALIDTVSRIDSVRTYLPILGNVGRIWVETNYDGWDVVATLRNGGLLRRQLEGDEADMVPRIVCTPPAGPFGKEKCDTTMVPKVGEPLSVKKSSGSGSEPCTLDVVVGIIHWGETTTNVTANDVDVDDTLKLIDAPDGSSKWASFAVNIGRKLNNKGGYISADGDSLSGFKIGHQSVAGADSASIMDNGFPVIDGGGQKVNLAGNVFSAAGPDKGDGSVNFFVNAKIRQRPSRSFATNANGKYTETMEFQFWGLY